MKDWFRKNPLARKAAVFFGSWGALQIVLAIFGISGMIMAIPFIGGLLLFGATAVGAVLLTGKIDKPIARMLEGGPPRRRRLGG